MNMTRKLFVVLGTVVIIVLLFLGYDQIFKTPEIELEAPPVDQKPLEIPEGPIESARVGEAYVYITEEARFTDVDEFGTIKRIFGYSKLLNPEEGENWKLEKPYMHVFEKDLKYEITSERGTVTLENVPGTNPRPRDARLIDNVVIRIVQTSGDRKGQETFIYMDDLEYFSERSEFSTEGPIRLVSQDAQLEGTGMSLIYNTASARLEMLKIFEVDYIRIMNVENSTLVAKDKPTTSESVGTTQETTPPKGGQEIAEGIESGEVGPSEQSELSPPASLYQCQLSDDVRIEYGPSIVVVGSDTVTINNINWNGGSHRQESSPTTANSEVQTDAPNSPSSKSETPGKTLMGTDVVPAVESQPETLNVLVTCKGPLLIRPMDPPASVDSLQDGNTDRVVVLDGRSVHVRELKAAGSQPFATLVQCGKLQYNVDKDMIDIQTNDFQRQVSLNMKDSKAGLHTFGRVQWHRRDRWAQIDGPGMLFTIDDDHASESADEVYRSELEFDRVMHLYFADLPEEEDQSTLAIKQANLAGGIRATVHREDKSRIVADSGRFYFSPTSRIEQADMQGNVYFESSDGSMSANKAQLYFVEDGNGSTQPVRMASQDDVTLRPNSDTSEKPTIFKASKIDYDITTRDAFAEGPIEFTFYTEMQQPGSTDADIVPVVITAQDHAQLLSNENLVIFAGDVVGKMNNRLPGYNQGNSFHGEQMRVQLNAEQRPVHVRVLGEKVRLESIRSVSQKTIGDLQELFSQKGFESESVSTVDAGDVISHIRLSGSRIDYEVEDRILTAKGPGTIEVNNENVPEDPAEIDRRISLKRPCYATVKGFDIIKWFTDDNRFIADGRDRSINIWYLPIINGKEGDLIHSVATRLEASYFDDPSGQSQLDSLTASGNILYRERTEPPIEFVGDQLYYSPGESVIHITGNENTPCLVNGALCSGIKYEMDTGKIETNISTMPSALDTATK